VSSLFGGKLWRADGSESVLTPNYTVHSRYLSRSSVRGVTPGVEAERRKQARVSATQLSSAAIRDVQHALSNGGGKAKAAAAPVLQTSPAAGAAVSKISVSGTIPTKVGNVIPLGKGNAPVVLKEKSARAKLFESIGPKVVRPCL
jgi:hypothetical protein